jgi:hypothetical protein
MRPWTQKRDSDGGPPESPERAELLEAYKDGRQDERRRVGRDVSAHSRIDRLDVREAYERGRRDERARHHGSPLAAFLVLVIALAGGAVLFLAAREGSFTAGGQVVDRNITTAAQKMQTPVRNAADNAGSALENAGQNLKQTAGGKR